MTCETNWMQQIMVY